MSQLQQQQIEQPAQQPQQQIPQAPPQPGPMAQRLLAARQEVEASQAEASPTQQSQVQLEVDGDTSLLNTVKDVAFGLASGPAKAVDEVLDLSWGVGNFAREAYNKGLGSASFREPTAEERAKLFRFHAVEPETGAGKFAQGVTQFLAGFTATGTALKAGKVLQGAGGLTKLARPMVQGVVTDFATLDAHEERLSNLIEQSPSLRGPVTAYLAADADDSMLEGRLKGMLEGLAVGVAADGIMAGLKSLKGLRKAATPDEAIKVLEAAHPPSPDAAPVPVEGMAPVPPPKPLPDVLPSEAIKKIVDTAADAKEAITEITYSTNLNRMTFESPQGSNIIKEMGEALADKTLKAAGPEGQGRVLADTVAEFKAHGINYDPVLAEAGGDAKTLHALTRRMLANRNILHTLTTEASRLSAIINEGRASLVQQAQFVMLSKNMQELHLSLADTRTELGRALSAMKITADGKPVKASVGEGDNFLNKWFGTDGFSNDEAARWLEKEGWTPDNLNQLVRDVVMMGGDATGISNALKNSKGGSWWGVVTELRINGLLSAPYTWGANGLGNALKTAVMPTEKIIGGLLTHDKAAVRAGMQTYVGLYKYVGDSFTMMKKAWDIGENILDSRNGITETPSHQASYNNIRNIMLKGKAAGAELSPMQEVIARSVGWLGDKTRFPSKIMITTDEFFKQINFRADMYARLYGEAVDTAGLKGSAEIAEYIETNMRQAFTPEAAVARGELTADSLMAAQRSTWTQALNEGTFGHTMQQAAGRHPGLRIIVPFIKTPTNIIRDFGQHTLLAPLYKEVRAAYAKGGEERARVLGQIATGQMTAAAGVMLAYGGFVTGSPPKNAKQRQALEATGWEPYSIKIGDCYYSYRRIDPVGMFLGQAADVVAILTGRDDLTEIEQKEVALGFLASVVNNVTSKTYMQGVTEVVNYVQNPERYGDSFWGRMGSSFIPASSLLRTVRKEVDPHMREMDGMTSYMQNTLPLMSANLPARHHWVTGKIIDYRLVGEDKNDLVLDELVRLGKSVTAAPQKTLEGVKLNGWQYSRLTELHGTVKIGGRTMHEALEKFINSPRYDLHRQHQADAPEGLSSPRSTGVNKIIDVYREAASRQLKHEDGELMKAINTQYKAQYLSKRGAMTTSNQQEVLQKLAGGQ